MGFLRRLLGGGPDRDAPDPAAATGERVDDGPDGGAQPGVGAAESDERARERELLRADAERLADPLLQRQLRYADRSWTPPRQGGERRADDEAAPD